MLTYRRRTGTALGWRRCSEPDRQQSKADEPQHGGVSLYVRAERREVGSDVIVSFLARPGKTLGSMSCDDLKRQSEADLSRYGEGVEIERTFAPY
jgi:hypothetical protein